MRNGLLLAAVFVTGALAHASAQTPAWLRPFSRAADPIPVAAPASLAPGSVIVGTRPEPGGAPVVYQSPESQGVPGDNEPLARRRPLRKALGCDCQGDFREFGCGSFHSEMTFIFGSCHRFFGDPCVPAPRHSLIQGLRNRDCNR